MIGANRIGHPTDGHPVRSPRRRCRRRKVIVLAGVLAGVLAPALGPAPARAQTSPDATAEPDDPVQIDFMNTVSVRAPHLAAFPRWQAALAAVEPWLRQMSQCVETPCQDLGVVEKVWLNRIQGLARVPLARRVQAVAAFLDDLLNIPPEALASSPAGPWPTMRDILSGQSRDGLALALARYYTLRATGVDPTHLRIVVARDALTLDSTYVVAVKGPDVALAMTRYGVQPFQARQSQAFIPIYAFNHETRWLYFLDDVLDQVPAPEARDTAPVSEETTR